MNPPRLLYLGNAFPPGVAGLFPELQPAGHLLETSIINTIRPHFEVRSVGISEVDVSRLQGRLDNSPGLPHVLNLLDRPPELLHRWRSLWRLRRAYAQWLREGWRPDALLVCNFSPVYNAFVRGVRRLAHPPKTILYLADSTMLGLPVPALKRLRYRLKPLTWLHDEMAPCYDACVAASLTTEAYFRARRTPWLWFPGGCDPARARPGPPGPRQGPLAFGYIGTIGEHAGAPALIRVFAERPRPAVLHILCFGKRRSQAEALFSELKNVRFHEPRTPDECVTLAQEWDVLVNPRRVFPGNENNFPSKVLEYAMGGRAVLSTPLSGADAVLGPDAYYFDPTRFDESLDQALQQLIETPRAELDRRGAAVQQHVLQEYRWERQGLRLASFIFELIGRPPPVSPTAAQPP